MSKAIKVEFLRKAREAKEGHCFLCGCTWTMPCSVASRACAWVSGSKRRLCDAHTPREILDGTRALHAADRELARA